MMLLKTSNMKTGFEYYYRPNKEEVAIILQNGVIVFDTNILLDVFRVEKKASQTLLKVFEHLKDRVKLPYHVVEEYHSDYLVVLVKQKVYLQNAVTKLKKKNKDLNSLINTEFPDLSKYEKTIMQAALEKANNSVVNSYNKTIKHLQNEIQNDTMINKLSEIFSGTVLPPFSNEDLKKIFTDGVSRYNDQIPPGYRDVKKDKKGILKSIKDIGLNDDSQNVFGDLVIWHEILRFANQNKVDVIFVSNDVKEDWLCEICHEKHGPRIELQKSFYESSEGRKLLIYNFEQFVLKLNDLDKFIPDKELKSAISSLDTTSRREDRIKNKDKDTTLLSPKSPSSIQTRSASKDRSS